MSERRPRSRRRSGDALSAAVPARHRPERAAVVGGGLVAARRVETLARAGALVSVYAPSLDEEEFAPLRERFAFTHVAREPTRADLAGCLALLYRDRATPTADATAPRRARRRGPADQRR